MCNQKNSPEQPSQMSQIISSKCSHAFYGSEPPEPLTRFLFVLFFNIAFKFYFLEEIHVNT